MTISTSISAPTAIIAHMVASQMAGVEVPESTVSDPTKAADANARKLAIRTHTFCLKHAVILRTMTLFLSLECNGG